MQKRSAVRSSVFLGGIPPHANERDVLAALCHLIGSNEGWSLELKGKSDKCSHLGFGFVHCESSHVRTIFDKVDSLQIKGKRVECKEGWSVQEHKQKTDQERMRKIFVSCVTKNIKKQVIEAYFSAFGSVVEVIIGKDKASGRKLGFCIVEFKSEAGANKVLQVTDHELEGKEVKCTRMLLKHELYNKPKDQSIAESCPSQADNTHKFHKKSNNQRMDCSLETDNTIKGRFGQISSKQQPPRLNDSSPSHPYNNKPLTSNYSRQKPMHGQNFTMLKDHHYQEYLPDREGLHPHRPHTHQQEAKTHGQQETWRHYDQEHHWQPSPAANKCFKSAYGYHDGHQTFSSMANQYHGHKADYGLSVSAREQLYSGDYNSPAYKTPGMITNDTHSHTISHRHNPHISNGHPHDHFSPGSPQMAYQSAMHRQSPHVKDLPYQATSVMYGQTYNKSAGLFRASAGNCGYPGDRNLDQQVRKNPQKPLSLACIPMDYFDASP